MADRKVIQFVGTDGNEYDVRDEAAQQKIGTTALPTTAQTLTGAIAEHESDLTNQAAEVNSLKTAFCSGLVDGTLSGWEKGGFDTTNGSNYSSDSRIRNQTKVGYSTGVCRFKLNSGYSTLMYAWDLSGNYIGAYKTDGTWTKTASNWKSVSEFDLSTVPNYVIKFSMARVPSSSEITASEGSNCVIQYYTDKTLTNENKVADAKATGDKMTATNQQIKTENKTIYVNLADITVDEGASTGGAQTSGGYIATESGYSVSSFIYIDKKAKKIRANYPVTMPSGNRYSIVFYSNNANGSVVAGSTPVKDLEDGYVFDIPAGTKYVRIGKLTGASCTISLLSESVEKVSNELNALENNYKSVVKNAHSRNIFNGNLTSGYIDAKGEFYASGTYNHSDPIDVRGHVGETIYFSEDNVQKTIARFLCAYDENMYPVLSAGSNSIISSWTIPSNIAYFVFSTSYVARGIQVEYKELTPYVPYFSYQEVKNFAPVNGAINVPKPQIFTAETLESGEELKATGANSIKPAGITYSLYAKVPSGGLGTSGYVSIGRRASNGYEFGINNNQWAYLVNGVPTGDGVNHGLTIKDYIFLKIYISEDNGVADITIFTNGGTYHRTNTSWTDYHGKPGVFNGTGATISDVRFAWTTAAIRRRIWVLGDSYISQFTNKRWPYYIKDWGYDKNVLYSGYPGEDSYNAYFDLFELIRYGKPSVMIWAMGMNNGDNGEINSSWLTYTKLFLDICNIYDITPILATIPCTPNADNSYKNAWIRESGYRYIEFANAVNVSEDSRQWYDNMLSSDNTHPDVQGAIALAEQVVISVPEVMTN